MNKFIIERVLLIWPVMSKNSFSLLNNLNDVLYDHVREFVTPSIIILEKMFVSFCSELLVFPWLLIVPHWLQIWFCLVIRETSCCLLANIIEAFNFTSRYIANLLNIDNLF